MTWGPPAVKFIQMCMGKSLRKSVCLKFFWWKKWLIKHLVGWLVVWNMFYDFPYIGNFIIPTDFHIFQKGLKPPTSIYPGIYIYIYIRLLIIFKQIRYPWYAKLPWYVLYISSKIKIARGPFFHGQIHVSPSSDQISICAMVKSWILCLFRRGINIPPLGWPQPLKYSHVTWLQAGAAKL